ncbi:DUF202 domain-containing protein [Sulfitobacter sp. D35]|nr:DUF202 domain-containing protein [Sulfitobacter sp. D35]MDW4497240.1 DUF202 domain-containing protein [Sulfitobacter sp. D35]
MAEDRTDWAEDRTILANERTFAGWMRTGMASLAVALGLKAVFGDFEPTWAAKLVAQVFVLVALLIFWAAWRKSIETQKRMNEHDAKAQPSRSLTVIAVTLCFGAVATGAVLWLL